VILSIENHCSLQQQARMAHIFQVNIDTVVRRGFHYYLWKVLVSDCNRDGSKHWPLNKAKTKNLNKHFLSLWPPSLPWTCLLNMPGLLENTSRFSEQPPFPSQMMFKWQQII
jgi:hypothetical protein